MSVEHLIAARPGPLDLNRELRAIDRAADRRIALIGRRLEQLASSQILAGRTLDLSPIDQMVDDLVVDVMIASHLKAMDLVRPTYALARSEIDKALSRAPKHVRDALRELYGSIARSVSDKPMSKVREALMQDAQNVALGRSARRQSIRAALKSAGIAMEDSPVLRTVMRTQGSIAFNAAAWSSSKNPNVWGYQYITAGDERVRQTHRAFEPRGIGVRYPVGDPFWLRYAPPNGWNCRCGLRPIFRGDRDARKREFPGTPDVPASFQFNPGLIFQTPEKSKKKKRGAR